MPETTFTFKISLNHIRKVKDVNEFLKQMQAGDLEKYATYLCKHKVIVEWSLPADCTNPQSILEMDLADWKVLGKAIAESFQQLID